MENAFSDKNRHEQSKAKKVTTRIISSHFLILFWHEEKYFSTFCSVRKNSKLRIGLIMSSTHEILILTFMKIIFKRTAKKIFWQLIFFLVFCWYFLDIPQRTWHVTIRNWKFLSIMWENLQLKVNLIICKLQPVLQSIISQTTTLQTKSQTSLEFSN